ncbi:alpha/beta hydrolase [Methylophaga sp.]|uniref:alpha/beta fold hydrolase n=1 Tax=Methylophaga sp. TaxID=2024840 RepID=UPI0014017C8F|nr:alpha/beta hydrolase [Methylophaga sp.]MTI62981.1 alpha/beta hydrolase [Methylophaga sp.]
MKPHCCLVLLLSMLLFTSLSRADTGFRLQQFDYPYPVQMFSLNSQQKTLEMAYMDVAPRGTANGETVVLFHGKNFCAATWKQAITLLSEAGYRVIAVDQIGFCKSSKPLDYQFSFHQLANNTRALLTELGISQFYLMGHSIGGMLASRYALLYPEQLQGLLLVNPIGLEDWLQKGVPYINIDTWYQQQLKLDAEGIKRYQQNTYYAGEWREDYSVWVDMLAGQFKADREKSAWLSAKIYDMILTQPVVHELKNIEVPTWLFIGAQDNTAVGKGFADERTRSRLGNYRQLASITVSRFADARLHLFPKMGHSPHIQSPELFNQALLKALRQLASRPKRTD